MLMKWIRDKVNGLSGRRVLCIGDLCLDRYVTGNTSRLSPEAPVPVLTDAIRTTRPGCTGNVAANVVALGGEVLVVGTVGNDDDGGILLSELGGLGVGTHLIHKIDKCTTTKTRYMVGTHHIMRVDREDTSRLNGFDASTLEDSIEVGINQFEPDVILVSDYRKGVITFDMMAHIVRHGSNIPIISDPKALSIHSHNGVTILKPNMGCASEVTGIRPRNNSELRFMCRELYDAVTCEYLLVTRGGNGMYLLGSNIEEDIPARYVGVSEVSGAGDTCNAILGLCIASGLGVSESAHIANMASSIVVSKAGTATCTTDELICALETYNA